MRLFGRGQKEHEPTPIQTQGEISASEFEKRIPDNAKQVLNSLVDQLVEEKRFGWGIVGFQDKEETYFRLGLTNVNSEAVMERRTLQNLVKNLSKGRQSVELISEGKINLSNVYKIDDTIYSIDGVKIVIGNTIYSLDFDQAVDDLKTEDFLYSRISMTTGPNSQSPKAQTS